jgi:adenine-specific DNA-methyltransferase
MACRIEKVNRLNYIGSKFQLLDWLTDSILTATGWTSLSGKKVGDLLSGTGIVSYHFRKMGCITFTNDAELYSSIISEAFALASYSGTLSGIIETLNKEIDISGTFTPGYITTHYSPVGDRMFFTEENALKIDYLRKRIAELDISHIDRIFLIASLLYSADSVSNVPAVYGCFLKNFKEKAKKKLVLKPIHTNTLKPVDGSSAFNSDILELAGSLPELDLVYIDPPYNERQYSKNYFPLNMIAKDPDALKDEPELGGKTGIPQDCFISTFCKKKQVEDTFKKICADIKAKWIVISYNSESLIEKDRMIELLGEYGTVSVFEKGYKRFKSFEYNEGNQVSEFLFFLDKSRKK